MTTSDPTKWTSPPWQQILVAAALAIQIVRQVTIRQAAWPQAEAARTV